MNKINVEELNIIKQIVHNNKYDIYLVDNNLTKKQQYVFIPYFNILKTIQIVATAINFKLDNFTMLTILMIQTFKFYSYYQNVTSKLSRICISQF